MIHQKRVSLMTRLAIYEKHSKVELDQASSYYRSDYISTYLLKNGFRATAAFLIGLLGWGCYNFNSLINNLNDLDFMSMGIKMLIAYVAVLAVYLLITYIVYTIRFYYAGKQQQEYRILLCRLEQEYAKEEKESGRRKGKSVRHRQTRGKSTK